MMSEAHQRQLLLFGENSGSYIHGYSKDFEKGYTDILKRQYNGKRVHANVVYQQYIADKDHVHMNSTCWVTLTSFAKHLGRIGKADIDETEKGWYITWKEKDQETLDREARESKKNKMAKDDEERIKEYIEVQIEKAKQESNLDDELGATNLLKAEDETLKLDLKLNEFSKKTETSSSLKNVFKDSDKAKKESKKDDSAKRKKVSALEEIMAEGKKMKKVDDVKDDKLDRCWIRKDIVVKVMTKALGDKYYKKKGFIKEVVDDFTALVVLNETGAKVKLDQDHLETVIPGEGREVIVLWGKYDGQTGVLKSVFTDQFIAELKIVSGEFRGDRAKLPYEQFSKKYSKD